MTRLLWNYNRAWTLLDDEGHIDDVTDAAVEHALAQAKQRPKRRERTVLRTVMHDIAAFQSAAKAESCFVLSTTAPTVRAIAYAVVHSVAGVDRTDSFIDDARAPRASGIGDASVRALDLPVGRATLVEMRERSTDRRARSVMQVVRAIIPIVDGLNELTVVVSFFVPDEDDSALARPMLDELLRDVRVDWG
ncbi:MULTISPECIES: hypothetical protein [Curtobacterium]|uniref:hypothetical protein n=1 Tax=Curtobacterium TaxID=2034 RepID=UPI00217DC71D|nr:MULTISPECIES: hypothetical protein [Curtobacterium]MCS6561751.1 hypothetical protein [Curtobacterium flaccumfaciens pv. poinsettiae]MDT0232922.1 hypothetical protein [Curtobacterium sp. BRB10]UXN28920.1 hypothetical protein N8D75_01005 [Curtobacterium flaccumfaciens]